MDAVHQISTVSLVGDDNDDDEYEICTDDPSIPSNIAVPSSVDAKYSVHTISLYALRMAYPHDNWKIQAVFDNDFRCVFKPISLFDRPKVSLLNSFKKILVSIVLL